MRRPYPTDLSDAEWNYLEPHLPTPTGHGRPRIHDLREILNAVFYVLSAQEACADSTLLLQALLGNPEVQEGDRGSTLDSGFSYTVHKRSYFEYASLRVIRPESDTSTGVH